MVGREAILTGLPKLAAQGKTALCQNGWLSRMPEDFREALLSSAIFRTAPAGTEFMHAGDIHGGLVAVASGCVEVSFISGHPETRAVHLAYAGFWASYRTLLGQPRYLSIVARTDVLWGLVPQLWLERMLREHPIWWQYIALLVDDLSDLASMTLADLTRQTSEVRAIAVLLRLAGCRVADPPFDYTPEICISQSDLASMCVMSRNTFNGIMARLMQRDLIEIRYRSILLRNPGALRAIVEADY